MKILYVTTISNTVNAFLIPHIRMLITQGHQVDIACNIIQKVNPELISLGCTIHKLEFERSPLKKQNYVAYKKIKELIQYEQYDLVHTHTPTASACVRLACRKLNDVKVIYTAHGFHFFKGAPLQNWLIYYPIEKWLSRHTEVLITINNEDYQRANRSFKARKVEYIPGIGLDLNKFSKVIINKFEKRRELDLPLDAFVILSIGELNRNKNHEVIIKAISKLNNPNIYYIICGQGPLENHLRDLAKELGLDNQVKLVGYRQDIDEICKVTDIFVFPSKREGLGMAALEAMAAGLPIITSNIHGIVDYSTNGETGYTCKPTDVDSFAESIQILIDNEKLRNKMGQNNSKLVETFSMDNTQTKMHKIYQSLR